jgi:hypothetical protein
MHGAATPHVGEPIVATAFAWRIVAPQTLDPRDPKVIRAGPEFCLAWRSWSNEVAPPVLLGAFAEPIVPQDDASVADSGDPYGDAG